MKRKTWTNIDACCIAHLRLAHDTDLEYLAVADAGYKQGQQIKFTDCSDCGRRFHIRGPRT